MTDAHAHPLDNPVWHALHGPFQARFREDLVGGLVAYPADVAVFAAVERYDDSVLDALKQSSAARGVGFFRSDVRDLDDPAIVTKLVAWQYVLGDDGELPPTAPGIELLGASDAPAMLALVRLTEPGPFFARTHDLGDYFGVRDAAGRLVALAGERVHLDGYCEISAVCTHPDARGRGLAASLSAHVARNIRSRGETPFLHVLGTNTNAIRIYERLGFVRRVPMEGFIFGGAAPH